MKLVPLWLALLSFLAPDAPANKSHSPAAQKLAAPAVVGVVESVSADGKTVQVATDQPGAAAAPRPVSVKLTDKTRIVFTSVGPDGARIRKGYFLRAWLDADSKDASRVHLAGTTSSVGHAPDFAGEVTDVAADGKAFTVLLARAEGQRKEEKIVVHLSDKTRLAFSNIAAGRARLSRGMQALVWLAPGSRDAAARVRLHGDAGKPTPAAARSVPSYTGKVARIENGNQITVDVPATRGEAATHRTVHLTDATQQVYSNVPQGGASPRTGYTCIVWPGKTPNAPPRRVLFVNTTDDISLLFGQVGKVSEDGKSFTVVQPNPTGSESAGLPIKLSDKTRIIYHNVRTGGAHPTHGYGVRVWLNGSRRDAAWMVVFEGKAG